jgi:peptide/nickel transport system substrate-binding protein
VNWHIFDPLFRRDSRTARLKPGLATSIKNLSQNKWEIVLRKGVQFHNGEPFDANSLKFTIDSMLDEKNKFKARSNIRWIKKVTVEDSYRVHLMTVKPFPLFEEYLTTIFPVPPRYAKKAGKTGMASRPVGTGPYKFVSWEKKGDLLLERNTTYWGPKPAIEKVVFRPIVDPSLRVAALLEGKVDVIRQVPVSEIKKINSSEIAEVRGFPTLRVVYLQIDSIGRSKESQKALRDLRVRKAIAHAINVQGIIKSQLRGLAKRTATGISPAAFGFDTLAKPLKFDPELAKFLLAEAGYSKGIDLTLNSYSGSIVGVRKIVNAIQNDLKKVGFRIRNRHFDNVGDYLNSLRSGKMADLTLGSWGSNSIFDSNQVLYAILRTGAPFSYTNIPLLDESILNGAQVIDLKQRRKSYRRAQGLILNLIPWIPMYGQPEILGVNKKLNLNPSGDEILRLYEAGWE